MGGTAQAASHALGPASCLGSAATQAEALALAVDELDCGPGKFRQQQRFVRMHTDLRQAFLPGRHLYWQTDPSMFSGILLHLHWVDGSDSWIDVDPQMAARNWAANARFSVPLTRGAQGKTLAAIDVVIESPRTLAPMRDARLLTAAEAAQEHFVRSLMSVLAIGMLLVPVVYTVYFFRLLRAPFMLWHAGMAGAMALFVLSHSGLVFSLFPSFPLAVRWQLNTGAFVVAIICAVFFTLGLLERGTLPPRWRRILLWSILPVVLAKLVLLLDLESFRPLAGSLFTYFFIPLMVALPLALAIAVRRGSRAALFALFGFSIITLAGAMVMSGIAGILPIGRLADDFLLASMVIMSLATSGAVGDRFMVLRMKLDRERRRAAQLGEMAFTDSLTGVGNRRAFDTFGELAQGQGLLVADLDHFKAINDQAGHAAGDAALCRFAWVLRQCMANVDGASIYRLGGEEFAVILPSANRATLGALCEAIRTSVAADLNPEMANPTRLTVSIGATLGSGQPIAEAFAEADRAMYRAKEMGRNRCHIAGEDFAIAQDFAGDEIEERRSRF